MKIFRFLCVVGILLMGVNILFAKNINLASRERTMNAQNLVLPSSINLDGEWEDLDESLYVIQGKQGYFVSNRYYDRNEVIPFSIEKRKNGMFRFIFSPDSLHTLHANNLIPLAVAKHIQEKNIFPYADLSVVSTDRIAGPYYSWDAKWNINYQLTHLKTNALKKELNLERARLPYSYRGGGVYFHEPATKLTSYGDKYFPSSRNLAQKVFLRY